jgi:transposase InsO family protein
MARQNYVTQQIDREETARERYDSNRSEANKKALQEEYDRTSRALDNLKKSGSGRGTSKASDYKRKARRD